MRYSNLHGGVSGAPDLEVQPECHQPGDEAFFQAFSDARIWSSGAS
jgi:hypothetical protein